MLRAVWQGDKQTFDESWSWTQHNIERTDHLFAWLYPVTATSTVASTTVNVTGSQNSASDADTNIALALVFAYTRWQDPQYLVDARATINSIWQNETIEVQNKAYVLADNIEKTNNAPTALVDPSYVNPAAYRIFARVDAAHPWLEAVDGAYSLLAAARDSSLDTGTTAHLPPDWVSINKTTAAVVPVGTATTTSGYTSNFGYDAMRVVWNVTLDSQWNNDPRATAYLKSLSFLGSEWSEKGRLFATYTHAGVVAASSTYETPAMYGATIGYFTVADPSRAQDIYRSKLEALFDSDTNTWREQLSYYDDNWAWFGIGLYNHLLPDLSAQYPLQAMRRL
jgi:endo-1,4-beta-D-glucanase Y